MCSIPSKNVLSNTKNNHFKKSEWPKPFILFTLKEIMNQWRKLWIVLSLPMHEFYYKLSCVVYMQFIYFCFFFIFYFPLFIHLWYLSLLLSLWVLAIFLKCSQKLSFYHKGCWPFPSCAKREHVWLECEKSKLKCLFVFGQKLLIFSNHSQTKFGQS